LGLNGYSEEFGQTVSFSTDNWPGGELLGEDSQENFEAEPKEESAENSDGEHH
jgi:hypothetical protein